MMDINKYLTRYTILHEPKYDRFREIIKGFPQEIDGKYRSNFVEIYSTFIFPRRIKLNGKQYIIVDHHFENLFAHYSSAYLCTVKRLEVDIDSEYLKHIMKSIIMISQASLQEEISGLALSFVQEYVDSGAVLGKYDSLLHLFGKDTPLNETEIFSNMFTILHEICHIRYNDLQGNENGFLGFQDMLKSVTSFDASESGQNIRDMLMALKVDDKTNVEELYCDFVAVLEIIDIIEKVFGSNMSSLEKATITIESIMLSIGFQALLIQNKLYWQSLYYQYQNMEEKTEKVQETIQKKFSQLQVRGSFLYTLAHGLICRKHNMEETRDYFAKSSAFDDASFEMFQFYSDRILGRALWNEQHYSIEEMKKIRNQLLEWN